jgi:hypothetical protein
MAYRPNCYDYNPQDLVWLLGATNDTLFNSMENEDIDAAITLTNIINHEIIEPTQQQEMLDKWKRISEQYRRKAPTQIEMSDKWKRISEPTQNEMTTQQEMLDKWKIISEQYRRKPPMVKQQKK